MKHHDLIGDAITCGYVLRAGGAMTSDDRRLARAWIEKAIDNADAEVLSEVAIEYASDGKRDQAESLLWALGIAARATESDDIAIWERRAIEAITNIDRARGVNIETLVLK